MNKFIHVMFILIFIFIVPLNSYSKEEKIITYENKYGGKTEEEIYDPDDSKYKQGLKRILEHYDNFGLINEIESFYTDEQAKIDGVYRREQYYEHKPFKGTILKKSEWFYTDAYSNVNGLKRAEIYYNDDGNKNKEEYWYTDAFQKRKNYSKVEVFYDEGQPKKRVYYDKNGKIISTEEKEGVWKGK
jgi:hypothetical protein